MPSPNSIMNNILIIGGTSGIGEAFARRWHSQKKNVIVTGRRTERLDALKSELPGLETYAMDNSDLSALPSNLTTLFQKFPKLDTVWVNAGIQISSDIKDASTSSDSRISQEMTLNVISPFTIARHTIPFLLSQPFPTTFLITGSGLGFTPTSLFPVYCATKAAVHSYMVSLRQALQGSNVSVVEITPPAVATDLDQNHKELTKDISMLTLEEFVGIIAGKLEKGEVGEVKECSAGTAQDGVDAWRASVGALLGEMKLGG